MQLMITLILCILISFLSSLLAKKLRLSIIIGLIVAGIIIGSPFLRNIVLEPNTDFILNLGNIGFISLMFLAGMEISWSMLYRERKDAVFVSLFAATVPILSGFFVFLVLGFPVLTSLTIGICMGITAEATKARVLLELKKLKTRLGSLMMGAGIIDDVLSISLFILVGYWFTGTVATREIMLTLCAVTAFFVGILAHRTVGRTKREIKYIEEFLLFLIVPFFFIAMGIHFSPQSLILNPLILLIIIFIAIAGKIIGTLLTKPFTRLRLKQLYLVGWGMNSRGAVELVIAFLAFKIDLIPTYIYSSLIIMALITTLIFPFFVTRIVKKEPKIME